MTPAQLLQWAVAIIGTTLIWAVCVEHGTGGVAVFVYPTAAWWLMRDYTVTAPVGWGELLDQWAKEAT